MELERDVERALVNEVERLGGICIKLVSPGSAGVPDRICLLPGGRIGFAELKRPLGGIRSKLQIIWSMRIRDRGFRSEFIRTKDEARAFARSLMEETQ